jgi:hypothetical protein
MSQRMSEKRPPIIIDMTPEGEFRDPPPPPAPHGKPAWGPLDLPVLLFH